jgi:hypothetical protein
MREWFLRYNKMTQKTEKKAPLKTDQEKLEAIDQDPDASSEHLHIDEHGTPHSYKPGEASKISKEGKNESPDNEGLTK